MSKLSFDPELLPVESLAGETPVLADQLTVAALRERFANPPDWLPETMEEQLLRISNGINGKMPTQC